MASRRKAEPLSWGERVFLLAAHGALWSPLTSGFLACHKDRHFVSLGVLPFPVLLLVGCCFSVHMRLCGMLKAWVQEPAENLMVALGPGRAGFISFFW